MNSDLPPHVWDFLAQLAAQSAPQYREKLLGITQWLRDCGEITNKQLALIKVNADRLGWVVPNELVWAAEDRRDDMPRAAPHSRPQATPDTAAVLADLLEAIAQAVATASRRLRP